MDDPARKDAHMPKSYVTRENLCHLSNLYLAYRSYTPRTLCSLCALGL